MLARMSDNQKLKQKSHPNNSEINFGERIIMQSLTPDLPNSNITNATTKAIITVKPIIKYIADITHVLLM